MGVVNLGFGRIEAMLKILDVEGAVRRMGRSWYPVVGSEWTYDADRYTEITALRRSEQEAMAAYGVDGRCLMRVLQEELDDPDPRDCGRCSVCTEPRFADALAPRLVELAQRHLRSQPIELEVRKMAPDREGAMRKIPTGEQTEPGWALARVGDGGWWPAIERGLRAGEMDEEVVVAVADLVRGVVSGRVAWVTSVPSARLGDVCGRLAERVAGELGVPYVELVARREERPPQREMANRVQQVANVRGAFQIAGTPPDGTGVLLDDRRLSGWTLAIVGGQLRRARAEGVVPVVLAARG
jgi:ATP-dependent DNA helicase RecQ